MKNAISVRVRLLTKAADKSRRILRVPNRLLERLGGRNSWVRIESGKSAIYRQVYGAGGIPGLSRGMAELDYDGASQLGIASRSGSEECLVSRCFSLVAHLNHPDEKHRVVARLALAAIVITIVGIIV